MDRIKQSSLDNIIVDTHNRHQMCIHLTLLSNQWIRHLEPGHPKKQTQTVHQTEVHRLKHESTSFLFFPPNI